MDTKIVKEIEIKICFRRIDHIDDGDSLQLVFYEPEKNI
jgi:hypothetical protein